MQRLICADCRISRASQRGKKITNNHGYIGCECNRYASRTRLCCHFHGNTVASVCVLCVCVSLRHVFPLNLAASRTSPSFSFSSIIYGNVYCYYCNCSRNGYYHYCLLDVAYLFGSVGFCIRIWNNLPA